MSRIQAGARTIQLGRSAAENTAVDHGAVGKSEVIPEHFLALLYGLGALVLGAAVWSAMAVLFGLWSLLAAPGLGWLIGWACCYGGRRTDSFIRTSAWLLAAAGSLSALLVQSAFSVTQSSPDAGFQVRAVDLEYWRLFADPPWFGSATVLLALAGTWRVLRVHPRAPGAAHRAEAPESEPQVVAAGPGARPGTVVAPRSTLAGDPGSRAA